MLSPRPQLYQNICRKTSLRTEVSSVTLFSEMQHHSSCPHPNEFTLITSLFSVCASAASLDAGRQLHALAVKESVLVNMYVWKE